MIPSAGWRGLEPLQRYDVGYENAESLERGWPVLVAESLENRQARSAETPRGQAREIRARADEAQQRGLLRAIKREREEAAARPRQARAAAPRRRGRSR